LKHTIIQLHFEVTTPPTPAQKELPEPNHPALLDNH
jgi:hypothetical protein